MDARSGVAKAVVSYRSNAGEKVTPGVVEFNVPLSAFEMAENQKRQEKMQPLLKQLAALESIGRARALQTGDESALPIHAGRNVDDFPPIRARFVRFTIKATRDGAEPCLDELELYGADRTENLAHGVGVKTTASSLLPGHAAHQVHHLTDGRHGNAWSWISNQRGVGWAQIELPQALMVSRVVWSRDANGKPQFQDRVPSQYEIAVSEDGRAWQTVSTQARRAATAGRWLSDHADRYLSPEQRQQRQELTKELEKLRP